MFLAATDVHGLVLIWFNMDMFIWILKNITVIIVLLLLT